MSILSVHSTGWIISHEKFINKSYQKVLNKEQNSVFQVNSSLFDINTPYKKSKDDNTSRKRKRRNLTSKSETTIDVKTKLIDIITHVHKSFSVLQNEYFNSRHLTTNKDNSKALETSTTVYENSGKFLIENSIGSNPNEARIEIIGKEKYLFPENCIFLCKYVEEISKVLGEDKYNLILLDPPWWNKYIRRIKKAKKEKGYQMMYDHDLCEIPIGKMLKQDMESLVVVWCTNSMQHLKYLEEEIFCKWGVKKVATWFWVKITKSGELVLPFNVTDPTCKQPFEQIIFATSAKESKIPDGKLIVSVPSALHSHKPPLAELLREYLPPDPKCLEIFARYLLPNWTSYGLEALRFQHLSCYEEINKI